MNDEVSETLEKLSNIENRKAQKASPYGNLSECAQMIYKVQQDCKAMTYSLRRIVCGEEDSHIQLG